MARTPSITALFGTHDSNRCTNPLLPRSPYALVVLATACAIAWAWIGRFSGMFFAPDATVTESGVACVATLAVLLVGVVGLRGPRSYALTVGIGVACAVGATGALALGGAWGSARFVVGGALQGAAYAAALRLALAQYRWLGCKRALGVAAAACTIAWLIFVAVCAWVPQSLAWLLAVLPCAAGAAMVGMRRVPEPAGEPLGRPSGEGQTRVIGVLMVLAGLLAVYMPAMYPKTTNIAPVVLNAAECLGMASWRSVASLGLAVGLLWLATGIVYRRKGTATAAVLVTMALVAAIFFVLPSMGTSAVAFVLFVACGLVAALFAVAFLLWSSTKANGCLDERRVRRGLALFMAGGLAAAVFAFVFLGPLYNVAVFQDTLFSVVPAVLLVSFAGVLFVLRASVAQALVAWGVVAASPAGARPLEGEALSVEALGERYGLTKRELQVLALLAEGRNEPYVETALGISRATVKTHITHIYRKMGVTSRQQLIDVLRG